MEDDEILKNYEIKGAIGVGGFGEVFKAFDKIKKRECALKIIGKKFIYESNEKDYQLKFIKNEIEILKLCKSKNVVEYYDSFETNKSFVIAQELCDCDLNRYIENHLDKDQIPYDFSFIQKFFKDLNNAIKILYQNHVMHRDIRPLNIFIKFENGNVIPKLGDFGIATFYDDKEENFEQIGNHQYMAPEVLMGDNYNYKCDLYSLGCTLYFMVFLREYYIDKNLDEEDKIERYLSKSKDLKNLYNLLKDLLEKDKEKRISMEKYLDHPFFKENPEYLKNFYLGEFGEKYISLDEDIKEEKNEASIELNNLIKCSKKMVNIMGIPQSKINNQMKSANILYYDENIEKHLEEIHKDAILFERNTPGTFILCSNISSMLLVLEEINFYNYKYDKRVIFNLIVTGSKYQKIMNCLIKYKYDHLFQNICIYCLKIEKYLKFMKENNKIKGIYNNPKDVVQFVEDISSKEIREYPLVKIISYFDYKEKYHQRHEKISEFYGNLTKEAYEKNSQRLEKYINSKEEKDLKIKIKKNELINSFKIFDIKQDLNNLNIIIREYTDNTFYSPLNRLLRNFDKEIYEVIAYYTARLIYALNCQAKESNSFFTKNITVYRGESVKYIHILPFERLKGKIILFSAFTSTSKELSIAEEFSKRKKSKEIFKRQKKFSVIYKIKNYEKKNCVSSGIDIQDISQYAREKEILYQPFSFYWVHEVKFDYENYTADIDLEVIQKNEILEERIREGKKVIYDKENNIMIIEEKTEKKALEKNYDENYFEKKNHESQKESSCNVY